MKGPSMSDQKAREFEQAGRRKQRGLLGEFTAFLLDNKKFWLIPLMIALLAISALLFLGGTAAAPFIYTLF